MLYFYLSLRHDCVSFWEAFLVNAWPLSTAYIVAYCTFITSVEHFIDWQNAHNLNKELAIWREKKNILGCSLLLCFWRIISLFSYIEDREFLQLTGTNCLQTVCITTTRLALYGTFYSLFYFVDYMLSAHCLLCCTGILIYFWWLTLFDIKLFCFSLIPSNLLLYWQKRLNLE